MRDTLPDGSPNPNWRNFAIFEPYAAVVRTWWQLFLDYGGQLRPTVRHIVEHGPYYPPPGTCEPPAGFKVVYRLCQHQGRWCTSRQGLQLMLTNRQYLSPALLDLASCGRKLVATCLLRLRVHIHGEAVGRSTAVQGARVTLPLLLVTSRMVHSTSFRMYPPTAAYPAVT